MYKIIVKVPKTLGPRQKKQLTQDIVHHILSLDNGDMAREIYSQGYNSGYKVGIDIGYKEGKEFRTYDRDPYDAGGIRVKRR